MTIIVTDGGTGTELARRGYAGSSLDAWRDSPAILRSVHRDFVQAGADVIVASTFMASANRGFHHGDTEACSMNEPDREVGALSGRPSRSPQKDPRARESLRAASTPPCLRGEPLEAIRQSIEIARSAGLSRTRIAASLGPGAIDRALIEACAGADVLFLETMVSVQDADRFFAVARDVFGGPIYVSFALNDAGDTYGGDSLESVAAWARDARPDAAGFNCGTGTESVLAALAKVGDRVAVPLIARPAASAPGSAAETPRAFAAFAREALRLGVSVLGGCCGAGPAHVAAIVEEVAKHRDIG